MKSSGSNLTKPLALAPFLYSMITRIERPRDIAYLVFSSWIPAAWLIFRLSDAGPVEAVVEFLVGYLAFISIYEIGYFINDSWDAGRTEAGRQRITFSWSSGFAILFVAIRIGVWVAIGIATGWIHSTVWLACFAALAAAIAEHNFIASPTMRAASFFQLSTLRFATPVVASVPQANLLIVFVAAFLFYTYFRFLSYLDSKTLLDMPARRDERFGFVQVLVLAPFVLFLSLVSNSTVLIELLLYFVTTFGLWLLLTSSRRRPII